MVILLVTFTLCAQETHQAFEPSGKAVFKVFTNWHQGIGDDISYYDDSGFELTRGVIGYEYHFSPNWSSKVLVDMDDPDAGKLTEVAYIRNAYVAYNNDKINAVFGIIGMKQFKTQENIWGYRYIYKSAMDEYKFNNSVDAGLYLKYNLNTFLSLDVTLSNGEGAKSQQDTEGKYRMGYGLEAQAFEGMLFRLYYDYFYAPEPLAESQSADQDVLALFLAYKQDHYRIGLEYNILHNYQFVSIDDRHLLSAYGSVSFLEKMQAFVRYDKLMAEDVLQSEEVYMLGFEYQIIKGIKLSPNFRYLNYTDSSQADGAYVYVNFEYKF